MSERAAEETAKPPIPLRITGWIGAQTLHLLERLGVVVVFATRLIAAGLMPPFYPRVFVRQVIDIGWLSLPVVGLTAAFAGAVLALQSYIGMARFNAEAALPQIVALSLARELAPVLTGLLVAGRVGAAIAAEIATMRVSEQIDALLTLRIPPFHYLLAPRVWGLALCLPGLVAVADLIGIMGGLLVAATQFDLPPHTFLHNAWAILEPVDITLGLLKALVFALIIGAVSCWYGFHAHGGARDVGNATTRAVVTASILILIANYFVTRALL